MTLLRSLALIIVSASAAFADVRLPAIFSEHVVLQRDRPLPVWGWADAGEAAATNGTSRKPAAR